MTVLAIADEPRPALTHRGTIDLGTNDDIDLVLGAGDLDNSYLEAVAEAFNAPLVMVPGNHDPSLEGFSLGPRGWYRAGRPARWPGPTGAWAADRDCLTVAGLTIAGLGGSPRYSTGPNQWTQGQALRRSWRTRRRAFRQARHGHPVDILLTHSPGTALPNHLGPDPAHHGLQAVDRLVERLTPTVHLHGHVHLYGADRPVTPRAVGSTEVLTVNTVGWTVLTIVPRRLSLSDAGTDTDAAPRAMLLTSGR